MSNTQELFNELDISSIKTYVGYYNDRKKLFRSASGGAASAISEAFIEQGGIVFGVRYSDDYKSAHFACARTKKELEPLRSSKYIYADKKIFNGKEWVSVFNETERLLSEGKKVLFIGLGCDIGALVGLLTKHGTDQTNLYTADLICHGPTYPEIQKEYIETLEEKFHSKIKRFSVRYKKKGWIPPYVHAEFENGSKFEELFYESDFGYAFVHYPRLSCGNCQFKGNSHKSDLTFGDFWGCEKGMQSYNSLGVSLVFSKSEKGKYLMELLNEKPSYKLFTTDTAYPMRRNANYFQCHPFDMEIHKKFGEDLKANGLHYAVHNSSNYEHYMKQTKKQNLKDTVKKYLPYHIINTLKKSKNLLHIHKK